MTEQEIESLKSLKPFRDPRMNHIYDKGGKFKVTMRVMGKTRYFGTFLTVEEAIEKVSQVKNAISSSKVLDEE